MLWSALKKHDLESVRKALQAGVDPNIRDADGYTPLHLAAADCSLEIVQELLCSGASPYFQTPRRLAANTPLHIAAVCERADIVQLLINYGADPDKSNAVQLRPSERNEKVGRILLAARSEPTLTYDLVSVLNQSALYFHLLPPDLKNNLLALLQGTRAQQVQETHNLISAIRSQNILKAKEALAAGANANVRTQYGTPLIVLAAMRKDANVAATLVALLLPRVRWPNTWANARLDQLVNILRSLGDRQKIIEMIENAEPTRRML